jgi:hypothetical protein
MDAGTLINASLGHDNKNGKTDKSCLIKFVQKLTTPRI